MVTAARNLRIAVIGAGISGNVAARLLSSKFNVELFEAGSHAGGHAETVNATVDGKTYPVDTGFMVFNDRTYPEFRILLDWLKVPDQASDMSFSVQCGKSGLEYQGSSLDGLFAQRSNLFSPRFVRLLSEIFRFNAAARTYLNEEMNDVTLGAFLQRHRFSSTLAELYLIPMTAAIWSAPPHSMNNYPARFLFQFMQNHGLLQIFSRPQWRTIFGGSKRYVAELLKPLIDQGKVHLHTPVRNIKREVTAVYIQLENGISLPFDLVVIAVHADQALRMLSDATTCERELLQCFPYQPNEAVLHTDASLLPQQKRAWASWNYHIPRDSQLPVSVTYDVNRLQRLGSPCPILVTLNPNRPIDPSKVIKQTTYQHPSFTSASIAAQRRWSEINGVRQTFFCGAYWGHGFHEDGVRRRKAVCRLIEDQTRSIQSTAMKVSGDLPFSMTYSGQSKPPLKAARHA